jgi:hypothetical protein
LAFEQTNVFANHLIAELEKRFSVDASLISLAGFSGGARVALLAATNHPEINAVIYCGAGMPPNQVLNIPPALGIAGTRDMNYSEVTGMDEELVKTNIPHQLIEWNGKHEWSDTSTFENAFTWGMFEAMRKNNLPKDETVIKKFISENSKSKSNPLEMELQLRKIISFTKGLTDVSDFEKKRAALIQSSAFKKSAAQKKEFLETESRMRQNYIQCFDTQNLNWWKEETARMKKIKSGSENEMYQRLLGYLSLACFSFSNSAINGGNVEAAQKALAIYQLVDSANSDRPFLAARLNAKLGNTTQVIASLNEALQLGFNDRNKLQSEEAFASLRGNPEFQKIEEALK